MLGGFAEQSDIALQVAEEAGAVHTQRLQHGTRLARQRRLVVRRAAGLLPVRQGSTLAQHDGRAADRPGPVRLPAFARPPPHDAAHSAQLVEHRRRVVLHTRGEQVVFPRRRGRRVAFELAQHVGQAAFACAALVAVGSGQVVPAEQESHELRRRHRLDVGTQLLPRRAVQTREQPAVAPFGCSRLGKGTAHRRALGFEPQQRGEHAVGIEPERRGQRRGRHRAQQFQAAAQDLAQGGVAVRHSGLHCGDRRRHHRTRKDGQELVQPLGGDKHHPAAGERQPRRPPLLRQRGHPLRQVDLVGGKKTVHAQGVVQFVGVADLGPRLLAHLRDHPRVEAADIVRRLQVHQCLRRHRAGAPLLRRAVVQEGERSRVEDGVRQG